jgi:acyl-CoA synthetase (AMP-forming)/AMP-acid ligase II
MLGLMQQQPLMIASIIKHAARHHGTTEVVAKLTDGSIHRYTYAEAERRARRLVRVLEQLGVQPGDRVATLAWNDHRHFEIYYAVSGMGAIVHTVNPRLAPDDVVYILNHAEDRVLFADPSFAPLVGAVAPALTSLAAVVIMTDAASMPAVTLPANVRLLCYESLIDAADETYVWPEFDENTASALCYTSGTTGRPKGVLYSHRSTLLHAYACNMPDVLGVRAVDRIMPVVPMFHANAWGIPYGAPMAGAALVMPGRHLDGPSVHALMDGERVTVSSGVPTVWLGLLHHLQSTGGRLATLERLLCGGSSCPSVLIETFRDQYGVRVAHGWGMTELSPVGTVNAVKPGTAELDGEAGVRHRAKQGRALFGIDMKIADDEGNELPRDGERFGNLLVRGHWVCRSYYLADEEAADADGWFATGDVATIDPSGTMEIVDRSKDVVKSGGEWISSIALENIAVAHPDVAEAAIIGINHPKWLERPLLVVVPKQGRKVAPTDVLRLYEGQVAKWWIPDEVVVADEIPHTATGKINKLALRARFRDYHLASDREREAAG